MSAYSVHNEPGFAAVYTDTTPVTVTIGMLQALLDAISGSLDFGSGFLNNEEVEVMRAVAGLIGVDPDRVTPPEYMCLYRGFHTFPESRRGGERPFCRSCGVDFGAMSRENKENARWT
jgi:hypothetical protein